MSDIVIILVITAFMFVDLLSACRHFDLRLDALSDPMRKGRDA